MQSTAHVSEIELVVFDLGGVIVRAARTFAEAWVMAGRSDLEILEDTAFLELLPPIGYAYMSGQISTDEYNAQIAAAGGGRFSHEESRRILDAWVADEYPGVGEVLDAIEAAGVRTAVLSNTNEAHWSLIKAAPTRYPNILRHTSTFTSHVLRLAKPDLAIFRAVETATGVAGSRVLFFDDVLENVEATRVAGWQAEQIDHTVESTAPQLLEHLRAHGVLT